MYGHKNIRKGPAIRAFLAPAAVVLSGLLAMPAGLASASGSHLYTQINLVSDLPGVAATLDPNLVNPWGLSHSPTGPWWISGNNAGSASVYTGAGVSVAPAVSIPSPSGQANAGTPTGTVYNRHPQAFAIQDGAATGPSSFLFATEDGTIAGWNKSVNSTSAILAVNRSTAVDSGGDVGAVYKGLASGMSSGQPYLYATNFRFGTVEMFDQNFNLVKSFTDSHLTNQCPAAGQCYAPFGIQNLHGDLYVTFALQNAQKHDDQAGAGHGFIDVFRPDGQLVRRLVARGNLNSPWGLAVAPSSFGPLSHDLLVGNFGDGAINGYDLHTGRFDGPLKDQQRQPIRIDGLWGLAFGNNGSAGQRNELFFSAGIDGEAHGVFGKIVSR